MSGLPQKYSQSVILAKHGVTFCVKSTMSLSALSIFPRRKSNTSLNLSELNYVKLWWFVYKVVKLSPEMSKTYANLESLTQVFDIRNVCFKSNVTPGTKI